MGELDSVELSEEGNSGEGGEAMLWEEREERD